VRLRLGQHCLFVDPDLNFAHNSRWQRSNRNSTGVYRDRQSRGQFRSSGTDHRRIALCEHPGIEFGTNDAHRFISVRAFLYDDRHRDHRYRDARGVFARDDGRWGIEARRLLRNDFDQ
jgi:hypothetical protein